MAEKFRTESFPVQLKRSSSVFMDSSFNEEPLSKRPRYAVSSLYHAVNNIRNAAPKSYPENVTQSLNISEEARCVTFNEGLEQFNSRKQKLLTLKDKNILKKCYHEDLAELFFLQNLGHLITEFPTWRKKTDIQLSQFYQANPLDRSNRNGHAESDALGEKELLRPFHFPVEKASSGPPTPTRKSATEPPKSDDETNEPSAVNEIAEQARKEAEVIKKVHNLRKQGLWSKSRLPKCMEPKRTKTHWDYLLEEMQWMAADFHSEAKLKIQHAKRQARAVQAYWASFRDNEKRNEKKKEIQLKRLANGVAKMIKNFWQVMEKFADMKQRNRLEETRIKALNVHLNHIIDKTQTYSSMLTCSVGSGSVDDPDKNDTEYNPEEEDSEDDITTLAQEEEKLNKTEVNQELKALTAESDMPLDQLMSKLPKSYFAKRRRLSSFSEESDVEMLTPDEDEEASNQQMEQQTKAKLTVDYAEASDEFSVAETLIPKGEIEGRCLTRVPTLLKGQLREYQHVGLDWLASLHRSNLNGILADEMGLGKTIQTIALLAHLAEAYGDWGPHLIVVPTSVIINWEFELKKWCPAFKVVSYYGSIKDRRSKRSGWTKDNAFHVLITSYKLVVQDHSSFRRMKWKYFILDEAQNIKNFKSQRWQMLLNLKSKNRLLLTGTPIQNSLMELWSLLHFLMPHIFDSHNDFREWFSAPLTSMVEGSRKFSDSLVTRLHKVLRPFLLRRLKKDVEKQMPMKHEHVVLVDLSRRQRYLYDEFMSLSDTKRQIDSGSFMSIMNILMQLRKVCNHPQLFDPRPVLSPFKMKCLSIRIPYLFVLNMERKFLELPLLPTNTKIDGLVDENGIVGGQMFSDKVVPMGDDRRLEIEARDGRGTFYTTPDVLIRAVIHRITRGDMSLSETLDSELMTKLWLEYYNSGKPTNIVPFRHGNFIYAQRFVAKRLKIKKQINKESDTLKKILSVVDDYHVSEVRHLEELIMYLPECLVPPPELQIKSSNTNLFINTPAPIEVKEEFGHWHLVWRNFQLQFPETRWVQYDSGKLQVLAMLLKKLKSNGHRTLIFTQMTKMLDVLEMFLSYHGYTYLRLDGTTKVDMRHSLMERFNQDTRIFCFILSTRSGGIGVNLTGADTVIFYDSDWNPTMDAQAQDRCHRIGQTKDVHIYRLICKHTVEENILKKANQKRLLSHVAIEGGNFTTASFKQSTVREIFNIPTGFSSDLSLEAQTEFLSENKIIQLSMNQMEEALTMVEDESDVKAAKSLRVEVDNEGNEFQDENEEGEAKEAADAISAELNKMKEQTSELEKDCTPIERWCVKLIEDKYKDVYEEELKTAKEEVELAQKELEQSQEDAMITALAKQLEKEQEEIENHFHTEDQESLQDDWGKLLPTWTPPTPPLTTETITTDFNNVLYECRPMPESQLPPVKVQRVRRKRLDTNVRISSSKERSKYNKPLRKDGLRVPRSLFDRPQTMRRDQRVFKPLSPTKIGRSSSSDNLTGERPDWAIYEDFFILYYINAIENKDNFSSAPTLQTSSINWDFVSDGVNSTSRSYRTAKHCVARYDSKVLPREEGRPTFDSTPTVGRKSMKKSIKTLTGRKSGRSLRTSQLILQDQNKSLTQYFNNRIELILTLAKKRTPPPRPAFANPTQKNPKHQMVLVENGITYDNPLSPVQVAKRRADRINRDKPKPAIASSTPATPTTTKSIVSANVTTSRVASFPTQTNTTTAIQYVQASVSTSSTSVVVPATVTLARTVTATPPTTNVMINTVKKGTQPNQRSVNLPGVVQAQRQTLSANQQSAAILKINAGMPRVPISKGQQKVRLPQAQANVLANLQKPALAVVQTGQSKNTIPNATVQRPELTLYMHKAKSTSVPKFSGQKSVASSPIFAHIQHASQSLVSNQTTASIASTTVAQLVKASGNPSTVGRTGVQSVQKIQVVPQGTKKAPGQPIVIQRPINVQALLKQPQSTAASTSTGTIHQLIPQSSTSSSVTLTLPVSQTASLQTKQHSIMAIRSAPPRSGSITAQGRITPTVHKSIQLQLHSTSSSSLQRRQQPTPANLTTVAFLPQSASGSSSTVASTLVTVTAPKQTPSKKS